MAKSDSIVSIGIFGFRNCSAWITAGLLELFAIANVALDNLPPRRGRRSKRFEFHVVNEPGRVVAGSHGVRFDAHSPRKRYDVLIVPPVWCQSREELEQRAQALQSTSASLIRLSSRSRITAGTCSGVLLLAQAGLLANRRATTCWWLADRLQQRFPDIDVVPDKLVVVDGNVWTAAAGSAYIHLGLELITEFFGAQASAATARLMLVERRRGSQSPFANHDAVPRASIDADVERVVHYLDTNASRPTTIAQACKAIGVNERTLARRFQTSMGMSPLAYLQSRRIARSRQLLEETTLPLERIIEQCGYEDISSFRKLFHRQVGMTPREYRSRFASIGPRNGR